MIRINLLGQARPKAARRPVPLEATLQILLFVFALLFAGGVLWYHYYQMDGDLKLKQRQMQTLNGEKAKLENLKQQVEGFEGQKRILQQRINIIEELQRNRTGAQELLDAMASTVTRTETLWLTSLTRKGNSLTIEGSAGSINAVANFISQLRRSGYFQHVEIKESKQDDRNTALQTFNFTLMADFALPQGKSAAPAPPAPPRKG
jgi:type IV pilus assembly protein PilN